MSAIEAGSITAFYLFDVAEAIRLPALPGLMARAGVPARLAPKSTPAYVQYQQPPLSFDGDTIGAGTLDGFQVRFKVFDYGIVSVGLTRPFSGTWDDLLSAGYALVEDESFEDRVEAICRQFVDRVVPALVERRGTFLKEDYLVFGVEALERPVPAESLVAEHGSEIALLVRGERRPLSRQEIAEIFRNSLSYLADDLVVPTWNSAFIYDTAAGAQAAMEILEFANSQLLQFRYYDDLLDVELARVYGRLQHPHWYDAWLGRRYTRAARQIHSLFIDINELIERTENSLKVVGDVYAARLFNLVAKRLGLDNWKASVEDKLKALDDIYRFSVEQSSMSRGEFLELTVVVILLIELVLFFLGMWGRVT
ncbi:MAG TPA: hypothetical protein VNE16_12555 [Vicinamibacterales bacterium]|nr:hypothetical protein [Vicinamibacterales bacterium]